VGHQATTAARSAKTQNQEKRDTNEVVEGGERGNHRLGKITRMLPNYIKRKSGGDGGCNEDAASLSYKTTARKNWGRATGKLGEEKRAGSPDVNPLNEKKKSRKNLKRGQTLSDTRGRTVSIKKKKHANFGSLQVGKKVRPEE